MFFLLLKFSNFLQSVMKNTFLYNIINIFCYFFFSNHEWFVFLTTIIIIFWYLHVFC
jgi:hypothetical protein